VTLSSKLPVEFIEQRVPEFKVSIIIPARNEEKHLASLLLSLNNLDFPLDRREIIVVDHGSNDNTATIAKQLGASVLRATGKTISSVRNVGAAAASGEILAFVDADCTVATDWLSKAVPFFRDPRIGLIGSHYVIPDRPSTLVRNVRRIQAQARPELVEGTWVPAGNMFVRREVFEAQSGFNECLVTCEDVDLCYRIARTHRVIADKRIRCYHEGEPTTLRDLFLKELWRGRANYRGVLEHGIIVSELPSLIFPIYFLTLLVLFFVTLIQAIWTGAIVTAAELVLGAAFLVPLLAFAMRLSLRTGHLKHILHCTVFYATYFVARGFSPLYAWKHI
jgi:glycosyltransferase involved in cell wall biosynthesis